MLMGMKYQTQQICQPEEIYHNTMKHLTTLQDFIRGTPTEQKVINVINKLQALVKDYKAYDY